MDVFIVRTKLQALIADQIIREKDKRRFILAFCYQESMDEDSREVYKLYEKVAKRAVRSVHIVGSHGLFGGFFKFLILNLAATMTGGKIYFAGVDNYPLALSLRILPFAKFNTFDDGAANILNYSAYYADKPLAGAGLKRKFAQKIFPNGCSFWLRKHSQIHYTIFPNLPNIVHEERLSPLAWEWEALLDSDDAGKLEGTPTVVVLGTPYHDHPNGEELRNIAEQVLKNADLYIMHPREKDWRADTKIISLMSPAEAALVCLARKNKLKVFHFNSTTGYALHTNERIEFVNLIKASG